MSFINNRYANLFEVSEEKVLFSNLAKCWLHGKKVSANEYFKYILNSFKKNWMEYLEQTCEEKDIIEIFPPSKDGKIEDSFLDIQEQEKRKKILIAKCAERNIFVDEERINFIYENYRVVSSFVAKFGKSKLANNEGADDYIAFIIEKNGKHLCLTENRTNGNALYIFDADKENWSQVIEQSKKDARGSEFFLARKNHSGNWKNNFIKTIDEITAA